MPPVSLAMGFNAHAWEGYNEAWILYILALGSPTHPIPDWYISRWYRVYKWGEMFGMEHLGFGLLFGHQFSHCWIDQGPIVLMIENLRNGFVWNIMKKNPYVVEGLRRAGFSGGWLK